MLLGCWPPQGLGESDQDKVGAGEVGQHCSDACTQPRLGPQGLTGFIIGAKGKELFSLSQCALGTFPTDDQKPPELGSQLPRPEKPLPYHVKIKYSSGLAALQAVGLGHSPDPWEGGILPVREERVFQGRHLAEQLKPRRPGPETTCALFPLPPGCALDE